MKESHIEIEGIVHTVLPGTMFRVELDNKHLVLATISGKMRKRWVRLTVGDRVKMEMSPYDLRPASLGGSSNKFPTRGITRRGRMGSANISLVVPIISHPTCGRTNPDIQHPRGRSPEFRSHPENSRVRTRSYLRLRFAA